MKFVRILAVLVIFMLQYPAGYSKAATNSYSISGKVLTNQGKPIANVTVILSDFRYRIYLPGVFRALIGSRQTLDRENSIDQIMVTATQEYSTTTDSVGNYIFYLPAGKYELRAWQDGRKFTPSSRVLEAPPSTPFQDFISQDPVDMIFMPAGSFPMGCDPAHNGGNSCISSETLHTVTLDAYYIDKYEVTNAQYAQCVAGVACEAPFSNSSYTHTSYFNDPQFSNYPVIYVNWNNAHDYCTWAGKRLPTEAEWEKAARGTTARNYPWGDETPDCTLANYYDNSSLNYCDGDTSQVGNNPNGASPSGVMDMAGNVWEWVNDWYSESYYEVSPLINPPGPANGLYKVMRGGGWVNDLGSIRVATRYGQGPDFRNSYYNGFRCASSP